MKTSPPPSKTSALTRLSAVLLLAAFGATYAVADPVYVTGEQQGTTVAAINPDGTYAEIGLAMSGNFGAKGTAIGRPVTANVVRLYFGAAYPTDGTAGCDIIPTLSVPGGSYYIDYNHNSLAGNTTTDAVFTASCTGGTLDFASTDKFQRKYGSPADQWARMGKLILNSGVATPTISFRAQSGLINGTLQNRLIFDCWRFTHIEPCTDVGVLGVTGPLATNLATVTATGVSNIATKITLYQNAGSGFTNIGSLTVSSPGATVPVPVTGQLVKGAQVGATQTVLGQEGCVPTAGTIVGGGANPKMRLALSIKENPASTGPVGANGGPGANLNIHFIPCTNVLSGTCPGYGTISITPGTGWQTVTVTGRQGIGNSANAAGTPANLVTSGYNINDSVTLQVYAYKTFPASGVIVYSATAAQSSAVTSNDVFIVNWTWNAVAGADGYRLLRDVNGGGYNEFVDVAGVNNYSDANNAWSAGNTVTPTLGQTMPSIAWNPTINVLPNGIVGDWGVLESIALVSDDPTDNGPYNIYIDNLENGAYGVFQDFEGFVAGTVAGVVFNQPSYSGTTSVNLLPAPDDANIVNEAAYAGTKSQRVQWQFKDGATNRWVRFNTFNTSVMPNPLVNLNEPISFKILVEPVGSTPTPPPRPTISASLVAGQTVLTWTGAHNLRTSVNVAGPYTNVPGVIVAPYTSTFPEPQRFFRLAN